MQNFQLDFNAIGTHWIIDCNEVSASVQKEKLKSLILERIDIFDKTYSRFREDSLIWKIKKSKGSYKFPADSKDLFILYKKFYQITDGKLTLLIGNALEEAGYDYKYSLKSKKVNKIPKEEDVFSYNHPILDIKKPFILDFGAIGKGYLIDIVSGLLKEKDINNYTIDAGGDILYKNSMNKPLRIGLEHPDNPKEVIGVVNLRNNKAICASSGNRRKWDKYHHIINSKNLKSPNEILATWVVSRETAVADGLSTSLFLENPKKLSKYFEFEYLIIYKNKTFNKSKNFPAKLFKVAKI